MNFTLSNVNRYPQGTSVKIYPKSNWPGSHVDFSTTPLGSATDTQTMGANNLTFTGLTDGTEYVAHATVGGQQVYMNVTPRTVDIADQNLTPDSDATLAANDDARVPTQKAVKTYVDPAAWQTPTLVNSWANFGSGYATAQYRLERGNLRIKGMVQSGSSGTVFTLPVGFRPAENHIIQVAGNATTTTLAVNSDGTVVLGTTAAIWFSLECTVNLA